jgi:Zn-dependent protease with chaperone function
MATDFFERQTVARRNTWWLVVAFTLSVVGIVATTFVAAAVAVGAAQEHAPRDYRGLQQAERFPWQVPLLAAGASLVVIGMGSAFKIAELSSGGTGVAEGSGGRRIYPDTTDLVEQRVLHVVEEMALASGVPVPPVFLLDAEQGINAFAAGFSPQDAVVAVTRGCAERLSRDQLQGVVAHEFSHILNGDMRLNIRLIGLLNGILLLGLIGRMLVRSAFYGDRRSKRDGMIYVVLIGAGLAVLGFLGTLCGNLIKAGVSRQREYLADASAVQFTRNPSGLAGALKRIGAAVFGSILKYPNAAELSHMYFAQGVWEGLSGLMATHPPLEKRILALEPSWDGTYPAPTQADRIADLAVVSAASLLGPLASHPSRSIPTEVVRRASDQVARPTEARRQYARELIDALPPPVVEAVREPYGARAVIYASLLDRNAEVRANQLRALENTADRDVFELTLKLVPAINQVDVRAWLPLVDMAMPALRALTLPQYRTFCKCFQQLIEADHRIGLFEWMLHQILARNLRPQFEQVRPPQIQYYGLRQLGRPCSVLLSTLARASQGADAAAFDAGAQQLPDAPLELLPAEQCTLDELHRSLQELAQVAPKHRRRLVDACAACVCADAVVTVQEAELLRAVCDMLDCPLPPLLPGQPIARQTVTQTSV